jgi:hypothetical protein
MAKKQNTEIEKLIEDITVDCYGEDEQLSAFEVVINDTIDKHVNALHLNEPINLVAVNFNKGFYAGLRAKITRQSKEHEVSLFDVEIDRPENEELYRLVEAYKYFVKNLG